MAGRTIPLDAIKGQSIEVVIQDLLDRQETLTVQLPDGRIITINPSSALKPLPELEGAVPKGWKDAQYE